MNRSARMLGALAVLCLVCAAAIRAAASPAEGGGGSRSGGTALAAAASLRDNALRLLTLQDYNTRVVLAGTTLLGTAAGIVGVFMLLRKQSLVGDVVSHASLPGIAVAFLVMERCQPGSGKSLSGLLAGALVAGMTGLLCVKLILRFTRLKEDAALAVVLSVFFGLGIALMTVVQDVPTGNAAGLGQFIFGKAASMVAADVRLIMQLAIGVVLAAALLFKELSLLCFDERFAAAKGWPVFSLDLILMGMVALVTVIGLQSVGLLLVVALLITPPAAARFWTHDLRRLVVASALIGGSSAGLGVIVSAVFPRLPAGAVIVLAGSLLFLISLLVGPQRGVLSRLMTYWRLQRTVRRQHLLRSLFETLEPRCSSRADLVGQLPGHAIPLTEVQNARAWAPGELLAELGRARADGLVLEAPIGMLRLTERGAEAACRVARNHRLWELYLIEHADIAPTHVDQNADHIEHVLGAEVVASLERLLDEQYPQPIMPPSPHAIEPAPVGARQEGIRT